MSSTEQYAVFGNPIAHSKSPLLQMAFANQTAQDINYTAQCVDADKFKETTDRFFAEGGKGLNITVPFKQDAFEYAGNLTERAKRAGAVNTLWVDEVGTVHGDTTDGVGLVSDIQENHGWPLAGKRVLIIGAGGAVRGVIEPIIEAKPSAITIVNRTPAKALELAELFADLYPVSACGFDELAEQPAFDVIINGTSASLSGDLPPLPDSVITTDSLCYDMMYGKAPTPFLEWAKNLGVEKLSDGLGMLIGQGAVSFEIWRGVKPKTQPVVEMVRQKL